MVKVCLLSFSVHYNYKLTPLLDNSRFTNVKLEQVQGDIYTLCKDQHGCRYLQKKLEERNPEYVHMIFLETNQHVVELMTGMWTSNPLPNKHPHPHPPPGL